MPDVVSLNEYGIYWLGLLACIAIGGITWLIQWIRSR